MPRPRKSRLLPSLITISEELMRHLNDSLEVIVGRYDALHEEVRELRKEVERIGRRSVRTSSGKVGRPRSNRICSVQSCTQLHVARGLCKNHYQQMRYVEKKASTGQLVRRRRSSGALAPILEVARAHGVEVPPTAPTARGNGNGARRPVAEG